MPTPSTIIQCISLYYFIVILRVNGFGQSFHKGLTEVFRCSLNQAKGSSEERNPALIAAKGFQTFFQERRAGEKQDEQLRGATLPPADRRNQNAQAPKKIDPFCSVFRQRTHIGELESLMTATFFFTDRARNIPFLSSDPLPKWEIN